MVWKCFFSHHSTPRLTELTWYKMCRYNLGLRFCKTLVRSLWQYDAHICQTFPFLSTWLHKQWQRWWRYSYFSVKKSGSKVLSIYDMEYMIKSMSTTSPAGDCYNLPYWLLSLKTLANDERKWYLLNNFQDDSKSHQGFLTAKLTIPSMILISRNMCIVYDFECQDITCTT